MPSLGLPEFVLLAIVYLLPLVVCIRLAPRRNGGPLWLWIILSLIFSWLAVLVLALLPRRTELQA
jgi:multisubunit Na+/H+ antiporter MnhB subunit